MKKMQKKELELLAPAGSFETFCAVIRAGADAVYLGGKKFGARAYADNFGEEELCAAIDYAHRRGVRVYLTVNTLFKEEELCRELYSYLLPYYRQGLDAVIVQDLGVFSLLREEFPGLAVHTSTQMTVTGPSGAAYMKSLGADRIVLARELSLAEIREIHARVDVELEGFVHGALCYCYSGQCLFSSMLGGRSGNRGRCAQPCRLPYEVVDARGKTAACGGNYVLSPKDLCTVAAIPDLAEAGVYSLKIEGRMKQAEYAAGVTSVYRKYVDSYLDGLNRARAAGKSEAEARKTARKSCRVSPEDMQRLSDMGNRSGFTDGYYFQRNGREMITFGKPGHKRADDSLQQEIRTAFIDAEENKEKINGILKIKKDFPAILEVSSEDCNVRVEGEVVQAAKKQPLTREKLEDGIRKTGNTPYEFERLAVEMDESVFLPVQAINRLRRQALEALLECQLGDYRRGMPQRAEGESAAVCKPAAGCSRRADERADIDGKKNKRNLAVSIENRGQMNPVLEKDYVDDIYLDSSCYVRSVLVGQLREDVGRIHRAGKKVYYILPAVFRGGTEKFYQKNLAELTASGIDGVVVKNSDALGFVREWSRGRIPVILDYSLYTWNTRAKKQLWRDDVLRDTVPPELNRAELYARDNRGSELMLYGYLPLMTSAQCVHANTGSCDNTQTVLFLKDRYGKFFPVKNNCGECYNTLYNSTPLILFGALCDAGKMGITDTRLSFTVESEDEVKEILHLYEKVVLEGEPLAAYRKNGSYTNGHYKRGVE